MKPCVWLFLALAAVPLAGAAGKYDPDKLLAWDYEIEKRALETVNQRVRPEDIAEKYKLQMPIVPPRLDKSQVEALIAKEVEEAVEAKYPHTEFQQIEMDAKDHYRMYKVGDRVVLKVNDTRHNRWITIFQTIRDITPKGVRMGDHFYIFRDVHESEYPHFFKLNHDKAVEDETASRTARYKRLREDYEKTSRVELSRRIWQSEGYVYRRSKRVWVPREEVFNHLYQAAWKKTYDDLHGEIVAQVLQDAGFVWNEDLQRWEEPVEEIVENTTPGTGETGSTEGTTTKKPVDSTINAWKNKLDSLWKTKDQGDEDIWDEDEDKGDDLPANGKKPEKKPETGKKPEAARKPKADPETEKKQQDLFGED